MNVAEAIRMKRAVREFSDALLPEDAVSSILRAGRRAQSSKNGQAWRFIAVKDREILKGLSECGTWAGHLAGAAMGVAILTPDPSQKFQTLFDAGQAAAYMQLAAWELGVGSCLASIYDPDQARQVLGFPPEWHLQIALSFGYYSGTSLRGRFGPKQSSILERGTAGRSQSRFKRPKESKGRRT